jgi:hypothetical protein
MKQKIQLRYQTKTTETKDIEIEFPIYIRQDLNESTIFTKRISPTETIDVHENYSGKIEIEIATNDDMRQDRSCLDYQLGTGEYASSPEEFEATFGKAKELLARFAQKSVQYGVAEKQLDITNLLRDEALARLHPDRALEWLRVHYQAWFGDRKEWSEDIADRFYRDTATLTLFCQNFKFSTEVAE